MDIIQAEVEARETCERVKVILLNQYHSKTGRALLVAITEQQVP